MTVDDSRRDHSDSPRIGLIAGWGRYPIVVAEALHSLGFRIYCLGVKHHADPILMDLCDDYQPIGLAKLGKAIRYFRSNGVRHATMAGKIHKVLLFQKFYWLKHLPDLQFLLTFYPQFITRTRDRKDDTMLGTIVDAFAKFGIKIAPATDYAPNLLVGAKQICGALSHAQRKDCEFGWELAREMGRLDVGQSVAVKDQAVLAVEAVEGTDECIRRAGKLCPAGGFTIVKVAKPQQDMRFDVPTIGLGTLRTMVEAGAKTLVVEAEKTIILDEAEFVRFAHQNNLKIVALSSNDLARPAAA